VTVNADFASEGTLSAKISAVQPATNINDARLFHKQDDHVQCTMTVVPPTAEQQQSPGWPAYKPPPPPQRAYNHRQISWGRVQ